MRTIIVAFVAFAAILWGGCSEDADVVSTQTTAAPEDTTGDQPAETSQPTEAEATEPPAAEEDTLNPPAGSTADIGDARVTVNSWRVDPGGEFTKPDPDKQWIVVDVTIENTGDDEYNLSSLLQTAIRDSENREHTDIALAETSGTLDGTIPAGQTLRGERAFEIPASSTGLQFIFKRTFGNAQGRWTLQ